MEKLLSQGIAITLGVLVVRMLPWLGYLVLARRVGVSAKLFGVLLYTGLIIATKALGDAPSVTWVACGVAYFSLVGCGVHGLAEVLHRGRVTRVAVFILSAFMYLLLPAVALPSGIFLFLGWPMMLSSYSYCVDTERLPNRPSLSECLFFMLVNPVLVFSERGLDTGCASFVVSGLRRAGLGLIAFAAGLIVLTPAANVIEEARVSGPLANELLLRGVLVIMTHYSLQSGLASMEIGILRLLGHEIPERFVYPLLAPSPMEFWRRWNTYLGSWIRRYIFAPSALTWTRRKLMPPALAKAGAVLLAFTTAGVLHDAYVYAAQSIITTKTTQGFTIAGVTILGWLALGNLMSRHLRRLNVPSARWQERALRVAAHMTFAATASVSFALWG